MESLAKPIISAAIPDFQAIPVARELADKMYGSTFGIYI